MKSVVAMHHVDSEQISSLDLTLVITERNVIGYLSRFEDEDTQSEKALEALKVGVTAIQSASPMLDTQVVHHKFTELEAKLREQMTSFQQEIKNGLSRYFAHGDGEVPRSINGFFGPDGKLSQTFKTFFDPTDGRVCRLMQEQIGPNSRFGKALDPQNKQGVVAIIEARMQELLEAKLDDVLQQFSLDEDGSAMSRLGAMLTEAFARINTSLGIQAATEEEARRGHVKGIEFEKDLYEVFAALGHDLGDETDLVRGTVGALSRCKKGDYVGTLGETTAAPGLKIVVEVKDQQVKLKDALDELREAKKNRETAIGIFVFTRGSEPPEVGDFRRIGDDFFVTVDKEDLAAGKRLCCFESAYKIARAMVVATIRKEDTGELDFQQIEQELDGLAAWSQRIAEMAAKARTIQNSGAAVERTTSDLKCDLDARLERLLTLLRAAAPARQND
jgi:hypothetical protein